MFMWSSRSRVLFSVFNIQWHIAVWRLASTRSRVRQQAIIEPSTDSPITSSWIVGSSARLHNTRGQLCDYDTTLLSIVCHWEPLGSQTGDSSLGGSTRSSRKIMKLYNRVHRWLCNFHPRRKCGEQTYMGAVALQGGPLFFFLISKKQQKSQKKRAQRALQTVELHCTKGRSLLLALLSSHTPLSPTLPTPLSAPSSLCFCPNFGCSVITPPRAARLPLFATPRLVNIICDTLRDSQL